MTRCDYDAVFYRVFCVTLLAIAFTFTVILTNVFIDIDGLLASKKDKYNTRISDNVIRDDFTNINTENDDINYGENDDSYRTKRSIETQNFLFHIKNPKIKNILTNRLTTLLEELDAEEPVQDLKAKDQKNQVLELPKDAQTTDVKGEDKTKKNKKEDDLLHLTMHNILLQGIIGHMDLNDVYKRVHSLLANFKSVHDGKKDALRSKPDDTAKILSEENKFPPRPSLEERFFGELINCKELHNQIVESSTAISKELTRKTNVNKDGVANPVPKPNLMIKTVIDITSLGNEKAKENDTKNSKENIKGVIEIVYNGKTIKFTRPDGDAMPKAQKKQTPVIVKSKPIKAVKTETATVKDDKDYSKIPKSYFNKFVEEYFKRFPQEVSNENKEKETKRLKRHVKIRYENNSKEKTKKKKKTEDDELYVEIETHFDSKGLKGEKKKKLIRSLVEKIQKAIHSDMDGQLVGKVKGKKKKHKQLHVRKRMQNPLEQNDHVLINKYSLPFNSVIHRQLNPITKTVQMQESSPFIGGRSGEDWRRAYSGPSFLTASKSINSAEMGEVDLDYSKVLDVNGIPQRLQKPLNMELSEETVNTNSYYDIGNMKFFIKDIDGSGFSIGFNQYVDEPPDSDTMKLFTGLENVIKTYHQKYDPADGTTEGTTQNNVEENVPEIIEPPSNDHIIARRSVNKNHDYHSNEYKIIFDDNFLPYNDYRDIFETKTSKSNNGYGTSNNHIKDLPLVVDENVFQKNLKPAEIFGLANLFERKKRSINVKKISNLKSKIKLNRYLNTKAMSTKRIFLNKKRNKRQINKIRIIATDLPHLSKHSDENIFVVSDENVFADRAIVKEVETAEIDREKQDEAEYMPYQPEENMPPGYVTKLFDGRSRHNPLMSKYPHIFMEEISRSREEYIPDNALLFGKIPGLSKITQNLEIEKADENNTNDHVSAAPQIPNATELPKLPKVQDIVNAIGSPLPKANYKVTVKILPKNLTGLNSGFKEIHTSINKRYNKNGLLYSSLVNVSEISKVVKLNRSKEADYSRPLESNLAKRIKDQQEKMQLLLKQHARHINEQLHRLNEEKSNIETFLGDGDNNTEPVHIDYLDMTIPKPNKDDNQMVEAEKESQPSTTIHLTEIPVITTVKSAATTSAPPLFSDKLKRNIISTIEKNENLTDQILKKIDKNTEILQIFLKKLTEKIEIPPSKVNEDKTPKDTPQFSPEWRSHGVQLNQNVVIRKNDSHISIPFVYAYQQPIIPHKRDMPVGSVVYHGHIHSNHNKEIPTSAEKDKVQLVQKMQENNNQSRFFIDELENDYKVVQMGDLKKPRNYTAATKNGTVT